MLVAIDPGWEQSAYVIYDGEKPIAFKIIDNDAMLAFIRGVDADALVIRAIRRSMGR
jgi:hypothetical protein